jgi:peptide/nickel transport system permease protein
MIVGNAGNSIVHTGVPVAALLKDRLVNSAILVLVAALVSIPLSILLGAFQAARRDRPFDVISNLGNLLLVALPEFVIGIILILLFATGVMRVLPAVSQVDTEASVWSQARVLVLPAATLALAIIPYISRMLRASTIDVLESDYVTMGRLKGLSGGSVLWRYALPNAIGPTLQTIALSLAWLAGDIVVVEYVFNYPGIGSALIDAVNARDIAVVQAICILIAGAYVVLNLLADIATILINPRLRTGLR